MKKKYSVATALLLSSTLLIGSIAQADDDYEDYEEYEEYEYNDDKHDKHYDHDDYDDDDYDDDNYEEYEEHEYNDYNNYPTTNDTAPINSSWNIWSKEAVEHTTTLPFSNAATVTMTADSSTNSTELYVIPKDGEFFVPAQKVAKLLGATASYYAESQILEVKTTTTQLIFRAGTNVVYETNVKTPLPAKSFAMNNDLYVPISTITNGLGYSVEWQAENETFICTPL